MVEEEGLLQVGLKGATGGAQTIIAKLLGQIFENKLSSQLKVEILPQK